MAFVVERLEELAPALKRQLSNKKALAKSQKQKQDGEIPNGFKVKPIPQKQMTEAGQTLYDTRSSEICAHYQRACLDVQILAQEADQQRLATLVSGMEGDLVTSVRDMLSAFILPDGALLGAAAAAAITAEQRSRHETALAWVELARKTFLEQKAILEMEFAAAEQRSAAKAAEKLAREQAAAAEAANMEVEPTVQQLVTRAVQQAVAPLQRQIRQLQTSPPPGIRSSTSASIHSPSWVAAATERVGALEADRPQCWRG